MWCIVHLTFWCWESLFIFCNLQGYRTGYPYRCPALRDKAKKYSDVEIAPSGHGGYSYGDDSDSGARSPLKHSFQRGQRDKTRWLNAGGRPDEPYEDGPDGSSPKSKPKVWTNITHDHVKPLLQSLSSGVCVPSCITNCLVCAYLIVRRIEIRATLVVERGRCLALWGSEDTEDKTLFFTVSGTEAAYSWFFWISESFIDLQLLNVAKLYCCKL